jgi:hypothetical protein
VTHSRPRPPLCRRPKVDAAVKRVEEAGDAMLDALDQLGDVDAVAAAAATFAFMACLGEMVTVRELPG